MWTRRWKSCRCNQSFSLLFFPSWARTTDINLASSSLFFPFNDTGFVKNWFGQSIFNTLSHTRDWRLKIDLRKVDVLMRWNEAIYINTCRSISSRKSKIGFRAAWGFSSHIFSLFGACHHHHPRGRVGNMKEFNNFDQTNLEFMDSSVLVFYSQNKCGFN